ncbi:uroporphyrinogen III methyltransferase [Patiriisocius marinistellae]|uniref:Uroporphyrinogen III methyltransferase n=1 Tax=Patiriisocius marinistellae TaxID=2494560 RepID=A0A5J4FUS6_9FLAO|nr:uroporphyrinogen-III synthase [Patiriisocius marinistellae]GEQ84784.1 uroporphyrinogen III methyltransferase [Patiriisocius marinistellae]
MKSILSTKKLKLNQRDLLLGAGFSIVDYNAINIETLDFDTPSIIENAIFTSQNGVKSFFENCSIKNKKTKIKNVFCIGEKTKSLLQKNGFNVTKVGEYGADLGKFIVENHENESFYYFCGAQRRDELPNILKNYGIEISEVKTYKTVLFPKKFEQNWDGILFFSPSGVQSYIAENIIIFKETSAICIGNTTATEAAKHFKNVVIANNTSVESVIAKAVKTLL